MSVCDLLQGRGEDESDLFATVVFANVFWNVSVSYMEVVSPNLITSYLLSLIPSQSHVQLSQADTMYIKNLCISLPEKNM